MMIPCSLAIAIPVYGVMDYVIMKIHNSVFLIFSLYNSFILILSLYSSFILILSLYFDRIMQYVAIYIIKE